MDLRTRTTLLCAVFAIAITVSILLRSRKRKVHFLLSAFAANMALWYLAQWLHWFFQAEIWFRLTAVFAVLLPQLALQLFAAISPRPAGQPSRLLRTASGLAVPMLVLALSPYQAKPLARGVIFVYVFGLVAAGLAELYLRARSSPSRAVKDRLNLLVVVGALALVFTVFDFLWYIGAEVPPVGAVLSVVFLFALAESMRRERLIDLYEMIGRLVVSTALAFCLAGIFYAFVTYVGFETMYLNAVLAAIAILVLFEPLRTKVEEKIHAIIFRQRHDLELAVRDAQQRLVHVLELDEMGEAIMTALGRSRRLTSVALYLMVPDGNEFALRRAIGEGAPARIEVATLRPILECLRKVPSVVIETLAREAAEARSREEPNAEADAIVTASRVLGRLQSGVVLGIKATGDEIVGLLILQDERVADAFSADEIALLEVLAPLVSVVIENSRTYARMKERDRLAALGQMAAGLAHEIKNPLGSIKGAAQLLLDGTDGPLPPTSRDFLDIIIEEVDRLDRVVGSALDYARPREGDPVPLDVNAVVRRTMQILGPAATTAVQIDFALEEELPRVRVDAEQLRQVLMNLVYNGLHAMGSRGTLTISTRRRRGAIVGWHGLDLGTDPASWVEISVKDTGQGISPKILNNLFVPFFSTKSKGTGLGLAISQRIVQAAGGSIEVTTQEGTGSTFTVVLPAVGSAQQQEPVPASESQARDAPAPEPRSATH
ncbi:MAG: two-component system sensor protein [Deltaproteobacteria bacterium]|nr:two-component system sensor protein [Deltaproteobacteria bacterium]